ncbi:MAG: LppX_LprAFG lipoprotein [Actinomycetes bacterium]
MGRDPARHPPAGPLIEPSVPGVRRLLGSLMFAVLAVGCSGGSASVSPETLVSQAKATLDSTPGLHFALTSSGAPKKTGTTLVGGDGVVARPNGFQGHLQVEQSGLLAAVDVISLNGMVLIKPPFAAHYAVADPHKYGFSDPGKLLDPNTGISKLLTELTSVTPAGRDRFKGEKLTELAVSVPGTAVADVLTSADKPQPVTGKLGINPSSHELRRAVLTGPFLAKGVMTTFTIVLDHYGTRPDIRVAG